MSIILTLNTALPYRKLTFTIVESSLFSHLVFRLLVRGRIRGPETLPRVESGIGDMIIPGS
ncbi:hypothetical protein LptCag_1674 [Leptospirillum ferriphilum]|uniref:Uncharacterized protein n=2 Tax=Leptospirillum ferriphilum TaxID=178606 RepID=A0A094W8L7_9BACT|nr:hypothetical protein LFML04_1699 [Leptospirillum ferriphilum ML-04]KGA92840.1 hypothetical protein LptCag_1674 [Leptospirillum ferriphilum]